MPRMPPFKRQMESWLKELEMKLVGTGTLRNYRQHLTRLYDFLRQQGYTLNPKKITGEEIREFYQSIQRLAMTTQAICMTVVGMFLRWCGNQEIKKMRIRIRAQRTRVSWLSEEELSAILMAAQTPTEKAVLTLLAYTARRRGAVAGLRVKDVRENDIAFREKGRQGIRVSVGRDFWAEMGSYPYYRMSLEMKYGVQDAYLIYEHRGQIHAVSKDWVYLHTVQCGERVGIHCTPHTIRRSVLRHMYDHGCEPRQLQQFAGHATLEQTMEYLGIGEYDIAEAVRLYRPKYGTMYLTQQASIPDRNI